MSQPHHLVCNGLSILLVCTRTIVGDISSVLAATCFRLR